MNQWCKWHIATNENNDGTDCSAHIAEGRCFKCPYKTPEDRLKSKFPCTGYETKMYKCIKGFSLEVVDGDGATVDNKYMIIPEESIWYTPEEEDYRLIGGEVRLESDELGWVEISRETLKEHFGAMQ